MPNVIEHVHVKPNSGASIVVRTGQFLMVSATTTVDWVAFDLHNLNERFDQARTKTNQGKVFISTGDYLISKLNTDMFRIVEDTYEHGTHDLQQGMCSRARWEWAFREGIAQEQYHKAPGTTIDDFPPHGCFENLISALTEPYGIAPEDIPSPFNIFQTMEIDGRTGRLGKTKTRPNPGTYLVMEALIDNLVAVSACPDTVVGGKAVDLRVYDAWDVSTPSA